MTDERFFAYDAAAGPSTAALTMMRGRKAIWSHELPQGARVRMSERGAVVAAPDIVPYLLRPDGSTEELSPHD